MSTERILRILPAVAVALLPLSGWAADEKPKFDSGDTAWMLTSTALVLMMTIPGLALFYGGMVRKKNVMATVMQSFAVTHSGNAAGKSEADINGLQLSFTQVPEPASILLFGASIAGVVVARRRKRCDSPTAVA